MNDGYGWSTIWLILIMVAVIVGAYFTTKFISKKSGRMMRGRYINVIDRLSVARDRQILLIEVAGKVMLIGISNQTVNILETFEKDEVDFADEKTQTDGKSAFSKFTNFFSNAKNANENLRKARTQYRQDKQAKGQPADPDDFLAKMTEVIEQRKRRSEQSGSEDDI